ncbi:MULTISPECIES: ATP-binding protein [unclassified Streptomyces]|uniref:ATP-binding protein n=1 Tax=unclassified Streptomyces TaxID=2593676 RepID=UPI0033A52D08
MSRHTLPATAGAARGQVRDLLHTTGRAPPPRAVTDDILLVVSELVTNACRHGGGLTGFTARFTDDTLTVCASDASPAIPRTRAHSHPIAPGGFGWPLIQKLSRQVTIIPLGAGKTIEVVLDITDQRV